MQAQDAPTLLIYKLWPWVEENRKPLGIGSAVVLAVVLIYSFISYRHNQGEIAAGQALTQALISQNRTAAPAEIASALLKVAADNAGTQAATRARLQGASLLFEAGKYPEAQAEFQKYLDASPEGSFEAMATFGVASSLEAEGQNAPALAAYQKVVSLSDPATLLPAKFAVARLNDESGRLNDALANYEDVARAAGNSQFGAEAGMRAMEIKTKLAVEQPAKPATPSVILKP